MAETVDAIVAAHRAGRLTPRETVARSYARLRAYDDPALFISVRDEAEALAEADAIAKTHADRPLFGVPVAIKDNIDAGGLPTTVACPAFSHKPAHDSTAVARLRAAGAIVIGKTNLDQFATGLVGVRSPYGVPRNPFDPAVIPGGSSSGSAVAVAAGIVPLALGTDTAGSGRVPAGLNNIVGLKPSLGLVSTAGVVPACRTLDCVSVFALTTDDAWTALAVMAGSDKADPYSRPRPLGAPGAMGQSIRLGVPIASQRLFFGDQVAAGIYMKAIERFAALGATIIETDIEPLYETARLLYEGPWVAERYLAIKSLLASSPDAIHPVTRKIILDGARPTAADTFAAYYELEELRRVRDAIFGGIDALLLPTAPTVYTVQQVLADPIGLNSRLGTYTNFVNLLDLCGLALPAAMRGDGVPSGVTLLAPGGHDAFLASIGRVFHADTALPLGALKLAQPPLAPLSRAPAPNEIALAVVGAHLSGLPLNHELRNLGARLLQATSTAPDYKLFALPGGPPRRPGMLRVAAGQGSAIELETWAMSAEAFGRFVANVPPPLSIGTLKLADGSAVKGFLVEAEAITGAQDISGFGGWRAYMAKA
ncbi:allophanate hydrolase [Rhodoplanes sp. Z2-YC6860]|uniref:allophanate hydrolase n=1 Tax=Rhodoplanes sp. Z2-YC6860 TaxID=674703 RepID=UPI00078DD5F1|nr:allophanate hydrolase [Rhodoplanes sp. Z2-YC6860]AMN40680.1 allophanate hydrolase [Rhodoplanes sp. Z2-YC6860]